MSDTADRTIPATPRRREAARRAGMMPSAAGPAWAAAAATTILLLPGWLRATVPAAAESLRGALVAAGGGGAAPPAVPAAVLWPTFGVVLASAGAAIAVRFVFDGLSWQPGRAAPDLARIDPLAGLARIVSGRTLAAALGAACGLAVLAAVVASAAAPLVTPAAAEDGVRDPARLLEMARRALGWLVAAVAVVAAVQWGLARRRFEARIRMTPQELADELKSVESDPKVRLLARRRRQPTAGTS